MVFGMSCSKKSDPLPTRHGVSPGCVVLPPGSWQRVFDYFVQRFAHIPASVWLLRFTQEGVLDAQGRALSVDSPYITGKRVYYYRELPDEPELPVVEVVLFQDAHLVVVDKPHFMPVTPAGRYVQRSLLVRLKQRLRLDTLSPIHRIDRETAGLVLFSVNPSEREAYHAMFRHRQVQKMYEAVAPVLPNLSMPLLHKSRIEADELFFKSREVPGEPNSETHITLLKQAGTHGLYALKPVTGQRHQLRVHMQALGIPIEGDQFYPRVLRNASEEDDHTQALQLLARSISFVDPITGQARVFESRQTLRLKLMRS